MKLKRLWWTLRILTIRGGVKRAQYARKAGIYAGIGDNVSIQTRVVPLYSELIKFHNNVSVARNVDFVTHDIIHRVLNNTSAGERTVSGVDGKPGDQSTQLSMSTFHFKEHIGCIEVMDNVFIGSNSVILYDTNIGPNVIIASGSVVTKDCEPNSVYAGVPAKRIGSFDDFVSKRYKEEVDGEADHATHNQVLTCEEVKSAWESFSKRR